MNGCGTCKGFWKWLKPPHHNFFKEDCNKHDKLYSIGGDKYDKRIADYILYQDMLKTTNEYFYKRKFISRNWYKVICWFYYLGVRFFGNSNFNIHKNL